MALSANGATREVLLDTRDDDDDDTAASEDGDIFTTARVSFLFSHGLINRGSIEANGWYDGVKADAVLLDGATIHGGFFNSGRFPPLPIMKMRIALIICTGAELNDGLRSDNAVLLKMRARFQPFVATHAGSSDFDKTETYQATAITAIAKWRDFAEWRRFHQSQSCFGQCGAFSMMRMAIDEDEDNVAIAFDFSTYNGNVNITQELLKAIRPWRQMLTNTG